MAGTSKVYRAFVGAVQFDPRDGEAGGKKTKQVVISATGLAEQAARVTLTLWPSHAKSAAEVKKGDLVFAEGVFTRNTSNDKEGNAVVYNNLSVARFKNFGGVDTGEQQATEVVNAVAPADDDIPY